MRLVRMLPERWQKFVHEALKFGLVGGVNTVINYAVFNALALTVFKDGQLKATVVATMVATLSSYLMNRHWTYGDRPKSAMRREYALFFLFNATGLAIELSMLAAIKYGFGITSLLALNIAKTVGLVAGTIFRFWAYRTFVFRPHPVGLPPEHHVSAELDPVAEVIELEEQEESVPTSGGPVPGGYAGATAGPYPDVPTQDGLPGGIDAELRAGIDAELHGSGNRPRS